MQSLQEANMNWFVAVRRQWRTGDMSVAPERGRVVSRFGLAVRR